MTKDEAITAVKEVTGMSLPWDDRHYEALQMAIEALNQFAGVDKKVSVERQEGDLITSAQPDVTDIYVGDMIYRQAAVDLFPNDALEWDTKGGYIAPHLARRMIEELPSVQPERTCVNCGRTANNGGWYADGRTRCPIEEHYALPKDGYCHLWEKRNVTDDNYPERREE